MAAIDYNTLIMSAINKFLFIIPVLAVFTALHSCSEDFLLREPPGSAAGSVMESPDGVESLLVSAHSALRANSMFGGSMGSDWMYGSAAGPRAMQIEAEAKFLRAWFHFEANKILPI